MFPFIINIFHHNFWRIGVYSSQTFCDEKNKKYDYIVNEMIFFLVKKILHYFFYDNDLFYYKIYLEKFILSFYILW